MSIHEETPKAEVKFCKEGAKEAPLVISRADRFPWRILQEAKASHLQIDHVYFEPNEPDVVWEERGPIQGSALATMADIAESQARISFPGSSSDTALQTSRIHKALGIREGVKNRGGAYVLGRQLEFLPSPLKPTQHPDHEKIVETICQARWTIQDSHGVYEARDILEALAPSLYQGNRTAMQNARDRFQTFTLDVLLKREGSYQNRYLPNVGVSQATWYNLENQTDQKLNEIGGIQSGFSVGLSFESGNQQNASFRVLWAGTSTGPIHLGLQSLTIFRGAGGPLQIDRR